MKKTISYNNTPLNPKNIAIPCGKFASYYPEGTFSIIDADTSKTLNVTTQGISANVDGLTNISPSIQWANV